MQRFLNYSLELLKVNILIKFLFFSSEVTLNKKNTVKMPGRQL